MNKEIQKERDKFSRLLKVSRYFNSEKDLNVLLEAVLKETCSLMDAERSTIFLLDEKTNELKSKIALGLGSHEIRFPAKLGIAGHVTSTGERVLTNDAYNHPKFYKNIDQSTGYHTRSLMCVPLRNQEGNIFGAFEALNKINGIFDSGDEEIFLALAAQVSTALENAQLYEELRKTKEQLFLENIHLRKELKEKFIFKNVIGTSPKIKEVMAIVERISDTPVNVLITGESGTGKDLLAKVIHYNSWRREKPFVALNCAALPESLLESELFGIEKGVATGVDQRIGKFEQAHEGTLLLDEIGDMSHGMQAKILRAIQERELVRVGGKRPITVDVRIISATNKDLKKEIEKNNFREDLYYRLNVVSLHIPPLRDRIDDIPLFVDHFLKQSCQKMNRFILGFTDEALEIIKEYPWPGNIRELENEVERSVALSAGKRLIDTETLSEQLRDSMGNRSAVQPVLEFKGSEKQKLKQVVEKIERDMINRTLESTKKNKLRTAQLLGLSREGLRKKMRRYGLLKTEGGND